MTTIEHHTLAANGLTFHLVTAGPKEGKLVFLMHGFPEYWGGWRKQIPALAAAGLRVIAPDQRGYNLSDKPRGIDAYNLNTLTDDMIGLADTLGCQTFSVVSHDWGGAVAWWLAGHHPDRVEKLAVLNSPHGVVFSRRLRRNFGQLLRSWYFFFFQIPGLPEALLASRGYHLLRDTLQRTSRPGTFTNEDYAAYREAWSQPGALTGMINWYRAIIQRPPTNTPRGKIRPPTLLVWGKQDAVLPWEMAQPSLDRCEQGRLEMIDEATHWVQHEEPERVNALLIDFLK